MYSPDHLKSTIAAGNVRLIRRDKLSEPECLYDSWESLGTEIIKNGSTLVSKVHKHEPSVPYNGNPIKVVYQDSNLLVVDKPSGIPVHATGKYHFNTVLEILKAETGEKQLFPAHRLDKNTTGVLVFAKSSDSVNHVTQQIMARKARKTYLARVSGEFPLNIETHLPITENTTKRDALPKEAHTRFERVRFDDIGNYSIVLCMPTTGRNHQIRQHLLGLGYPIQNDREYNPDLESAKRREKVKCGVCDECGFDLYEDRHDELYLHALKYELEEGTFETEWPEWAGEGETK